MKRLLLASIAFVALVAGSAMAADLAPAVYRRPVAVPVAVYNWTGFYVGGNLGYSWGKADADVIVPSSTAPAPNSTALIFSSIGIPGVAFTDSAKPQGVIGGGQIGYNWQPSRNWVFGLEADLQASGEKATSSRADPFTFVNEQTNFIGTFGTAVGGATTTAYEARISWFGTLRGRVGYAWNNLLFYGTGGLAYGRVNISGATTISGTESCVVLFPLLCALTGALPVPFSSTTAFGASRVNVGWTLGGGIEGVLWGNWTWKLEYLYMDLGTLGIAATTSAGSLQTVNTRFTDNIVRVGLNYKFGNYYTPVVTKY